MNNKIEKIQISEVLEELGLPPDSEYLGYLIHRPDTDDFVMLASDNKECSLWMWSDTPEGAFKFQDYSYVTKLASIYNKAPVMVGLVFDTGNMLVFTSSTGQLH
ncbi:hypothetical protein [Rheinheimera sp.]|uniref:hypothetical protein n=1 Tax=Rheinheimera sp. TaxID=1869214 RepID=UPI0027373258|nr:hypothetical protein [Rheinheimera sp.]MDP2716291.1 hypothetical protein [Rheinheimera sp.]